MNSCLLCVSGICLLCLVFAMDSKSKRVEAKDKVFTECAHMVELNPEMMLLVMRGQWPENNESLLLWVHCVLVKSEIMTEKGVFRIEVALRGLPEMEAARVHNSIMKCSKPYDANMLPAEVSWEFAKCFQKHDPEHSLL